ncbi:SEC-C metal-binding domain-containing protein [Desulfurivibrio alkaliphilus]|uniref:SEC-C motif domain protein n=1 Tax=Desulfurivibrio alkaliphilus (strain DSM 19089 / UNIQEM U267 / AHT2) TaxID=589865 RepID=D6Z2H7_DESAT|nr:SEC-C metal-binding domain-containing protein [Desulfurivibrio alkaliphilus]ADH85752.1 SEC-C motif domain protein [Desulfurivibrio alkaliphilus AHT 2]
MAKIGRNDPCPCGSGKKFKKCCLEKQRLAGRTPAAASQPPSLTGEIKTLQEAAAGRQVLFKTLGVFVLFTTQPGDAWVLEVTEMDAVQVAREGEAIAVEIEETPETLEINWTHRFQLTDKGRKLELESYADQGTSTIPQCPTQQIRAAVKKIKSRLSPELLESIHLQQQQEEENALRRGVKSSSRS